jgi:hypothetical protein
LILVGLATRLTVGAEGGGVEGVEATKLIETWADPDLGTLTVLLWLT